MYTLYNEQFWEYERGVRKRWGRNLRQTRKRIVADRGSGSIRAPGQSRFHIM